MKNEDEDLFVKPAESASGSTITQLRAEDANTQHSPITQTHTDEEKTGLLDWVKDFFKPKRDANNLREAIEEYIEEMDDEESVSVGAHERALISNILKLRDLTVLDVMVPRADIVSIDIDTSHEDLLKLLEDKQFSRIVVYRDTLDEVVGTIHIKDIVAHLAQDKSFVISDLVRDVPIISPSLPILDLLLHIQQSKKHMALVIDEFGGIDGLVTIGDVIESVLGEVEDEFEQDTGPQFETKADGSVIADARADIEDFIECFGDVLTPEDIEDNDTLGGLVFSIAGRIPARGEILKHSSGIIFEILDADPRKVARLRIKNIPQTHTAKPITHD